jgi:hypothetical protein
MPQARMLRRVVDSNKPVLVGRSKLCHRQELEHAFSKRGGVRPKEKREKKKRNSMDASDLEGIQHSLQDVQVRSTTTRQLHLPPPPLCAAVSLVSEWEKRDR